MPGKRNSAIFYRRGIPNGNIQFGSLVNTNLTFPINRNINTNYVSPNVGSIPNPPTNVTATSRYQSAMLAFTPSTGTGIYYLVYNADTNTQVYFTTINSSSLNIPNLINGNSYSFYIKSFNSAGASIPSNTSNTIIPTFTVPDPPSITSVVIGNGSATFYYTPSLYTGGYSIINYKYLIDNDNDVVMNSIDGSYNVSGLTNGTVYNLTLESANILGYSSASLSYAFTPSALAPDPPTINSTSIGTNYGNLYFTPGYNNGSAITAFYTYDASTNTLQSDVSYNLQSGSETATIHNLNPGQSYSFYMKNENSVGISIASNNSGTIIPDNNVVPDPPTNLSVDVITTDNTIGDYTVTAIPPANSDRPVITKYTFSDGSNNYDVSFNAGIDPSYTFIGLTITNSYTFTVTATNSVGTSNPSVPTTTITYTLTPTVASGQSGSYPFMGTINTVITDTNISILSDLESFSFEISSKIPDPSYNDGIIVPLTEPISSSFTTSYLNTNNYVNTGAKTVQIPVFGLYQNYTNTVIFTVVPNSFITGTGIQTFTVPFSTGTWNGTNHSLFSNPTKTTTRNSTLLDYSTFLMKTVGNIIDIDSEVRWTSNMSNINSVGFIDNSYNTLYYTTSNQLFAFNLFTGSNVTLGTYSSVTNNMNHHNIDPGKCPNTFFVCAQSLNGITSSNIGNIENMVIELDTSGNLIKTFDILQILYNYMIDQGEDPTIVPTPLNYNSGDTSFINSNDWFHLNASCYCPSYNEVIMTGREDFIIAIDYDTEEIKWILGYSITDVSSNNYYPKNWYNNYASLRSKTLTLVANSIYPDVSLNFYPNGQHAVQIDPNNNDNLLCFNNMLGGGAHIPAGPNPVNNNPTQYTAQNSAGMKFYIDRNALTASIIYYFDNTLTSNGQAGPISSLITSNFYQTGNTYLANFSAAGSNNGNLVGTGPIIIGVDSEQNVAFQYKYGPFNPGVGLGWNAVPVNFNNLYFDLINVTNPYAPTSLVATLISGTNGVNLTWQSPTNNGGSPILSYTVFLSTDPSTNVIVSGTIGVPGDYNIPPNTYVTFSAPASASSTTASFYVISTNNNGFSSPYSIQSNSVTIPPATVPFPPTNLIATPGDAFATISFTPGLTGGYPILNYIAYDSSGNAYNTGQTSSPITIDNLINNLEYIFYLKAFNTLGASVASSTVSVTPTNSGIITQGLQLYLDAGNTSSYTSGSVWTNLIVDSSINTFTLVNSPSYSSNYGGYLSFTQNLLQYGVTTDALPLNYWSLETWFYYNGPQSGLSPCIITNVFTNNGINYGIGNLNEQGLTNNQISTFGFNNSTFFSKSPILTFSDIGWYHLVGTFDTSYNMTLYANGVSQGSTDCSNNIPQQNTNGINLMKRWDQTDCFNGGLSIVRIYNYALTQSQIVNNYNYEKSRFGL